MATKRYTVLIVLLFLIQYLGSSANDAPKACMKCVKSKTGNDHHLPQMVSSSSNNTSKAVRFTRDIFGLAPSAFNTMITTSNSIDERKRPENSNTLHQTRDEQLSRHHLHQHQKDIQNARHHHAPGDTADEYALPVLSRVPRVAQKPESFENLRKKLKGDKQGKISTDKFDTRLSRFNRTAVRHSEPHVVGGINREERPHPKKKDNLRKLYEFSNTERREPYINPGTECNFEKDCRWTWKTDIQNGFVIASSHNLLINESGPREDADNTDNGEYLFKVIYTESSI